MKRQGREIRCCDYGNQPYARVRDVLMQNAVTVLQSATKTAASRARSVAGELQIDFRAIGVKSDIKIGSKSVEDRVTKANSIPTTTFAIGMGGGDHATVFPAHEGRAFRVPTDRY